MATLTFLYLQWHYTRALADLAVISSNFFWFVYEFFSIPLLLRTLVVPFRRITETPQRTFDIGAWLAAKTVNTLMRLVGVVVRLWVIVLGFLSLCCVTLLSGVAFCLWLAAPLLFVTLAFIGTFLVFAV